MAKDKRRKKKKKLGAAAVIGSVLLTLALAALAVYGMLSYGRSRPAPAALREGSGVPASEAVSLVRGEEPTTAQAPAAAAAPAVEEEEYVSFGYEGVLYDDDGIFMAKIRGVRYVGFVVIVDDPMRLTVGKCPYFGAGAYGRTVKQMADEAGAVLAINGGGFADPNGEGKGGSPTGNVVLDGKLLAGYWAPTVGIDADGKMHVGEFNGNTCMDLGLRWAVSYGPTLVQDGKVCGGLDNTNQEPRTAIGQRSDGKVVIIVLQGRQLQALGVTCRQLAEIMIDFGCVCASNLDGGASSDLYFQGDYVNVCNTSGGPRPIPTSVLVMPSAPAGEEG